MKTPIMGWQIKGTHQGDLDVTLKPTVGYPNLAVIPVIESI